MSAALTDIVAGSGSATTNGLKIRSATDSGDIFSSDGYFFTKVALCAVVRANDVDSVSTASAYAVLKDGSIVDIGSRTQTWYNSNYYATYDLTTWDTTTLFNIDHIHYSVYSYRGKNDGHGGEGGGGTADATVYQRAFPWINYD